MFNLFGFGKSGPIINNNQLNDKINEVKLNDEETIIKLFGNLLSQHADTSVTTLTKNFKFQTVIDQLKNNQQVKIQFNPFNVPFHYLLALAVLKQDYPEHLIIFLAQNFTLDPKSKEQLNYLTTSIQKTTPYFNPELVQQIAINVLAQLKASNEKPLDENHPDNTKEQESEITTTTPDTNAQQAETDTPPSSTQQPPIPPPPPMSGQSKLRNTQSVATNQPLESRGVGAQGEKGKGKFDIEQIAEKARERQERAQTQQLQRANQVRFPKDQTKIICGTTTTTTEPVENTISSPQQENFNAIQKIMKQFQDEAKRHQAEELQPLQNASKAKKLTNLWPDPMQKPESPKSVDLTKQPPVETTSIDFGAARAAVERLSQTPKEPSKPDQYHPPNKSTVYYVATTLGLMFAGRGKPSEEQNLPKEYQQFLKELGEIVTLYSKLIPNDSELPEKKQFIYDVDFDQSRSSEMIIILLGYMQQKLQNLPEDNRVLAEEQNPGATYNYLIGAIETHLKKFKVEDKTLPSDTISQTASEATTLKPT
ncbi:MAG: hypothetical protein AMJ43_03395 [Coxiella sp. DG_40]|nr:MAG: hypothetical protein AMJ43_03395 [Coxiella sp. DG_40]